jgi:hypothetical protein
MCAPPENPVHSDCRMRSCGTKAQRQRTTELRREVVRVRVRIASRRKVRRPRFEGREPAVERRVRRRGCTTYATPGDPCATAVRRRRRDGSAKVEAFVVREACGGALKEGRKGSIDEGEGLAEEKGALRVARPKCQVFKYFSLHIGGLWQCLCGGAAQTAQAAG